jgi:hypothetical protein
MTERQRNPQSLLLLLLTRRSQLKLNDVIALGVLCSLLAAGGAIIQNYSAVQATTRSTAPVSGPFTYSTAMRHRFLTDQTPSAAEEQCAYMELYERAKAQKDPHEVKLIGEAHRRHRDNWRKHLLAMKRRARLQRQSAGSINAAAPSVQKQALPTIKARKPLTPENRNNVITINNRSFTLARINPNFLPYIDDLFHAEQQGIF